MPKTDFRTPEERFWARVDTCSDITQCWPWTGSVREARGGYGQFGLNGGVALTHIYAWAREHGPIPKGLCVCHRCDNPPCCNSAHLFLGTRADNNADRVAKGRSNPLTGEDAHQAKLTWAQVRSIRSRAGTATNRQLAREFGVGKSTIGYILQGKLWREAA